MPQSSKARAAETPRDRLYAEIVAVAQTGLERFYAEFPEYAEDDRAKEAANWSLRGVRRILQVLDKYEISDPPEEGR
jgi:hypothetical protein